MTEVQEQQATADMVAEGSPAIPAAEPSAQASVDSPTSDLVHRDPPPKIGPQISVGRIVSYTLNQYNADAINRRRGANKHDPAWPQGAVAHEGNYAYAGDVVPMLVVRAWSEDMVNGQVFLDGNDSLWVTSVHSAKADGEQGAWTWPIRT